MYVLVETVQCISLSQDRTCPGVESNQAPCGYKSKSVAIIPTCSVNVLLAKNTAFWNITQCNVVHSYRCFGGIYCFHHQDWGMAACSSKLGNDLQEYTASHPRIITAVRTSNLKSLLVNVYPLSGLLLGCLLILL
jgi:hypothetical protein